MTLNDLESLHASLTPSAGDAFIQAIRDAEKDPGVRPFLLRGFLDRIIDEFSAEGRRICSLGDEMTAEDRTLLTLYGRIIAAEIILLFKSKSPAALRGRVLLFLEYASAVVRTKYNYLTTALDVICYKITDPGIDLRTVKETTSLDLLSYMLITGIRFDKSSSERFSFQGRGQVQCQDGELSVSSSGAIESGARAFGICGDRIGVYTRNVRDEKLKSTEQYSASSLRAFADTFLRVQEDGARKGALRHEYVSGETVDIKVLGFTADEENLLCRVVGEDASVTGPLVNEELIKGVWTRDIIDYFFKDDCVRGAVLYRDGDGYSFSIADAYTAYARAQAEKDQRDGICFRAKVYNVNEKWGRVNWITPSGYGGISKCGDTPGVKAGDTAVLQVLNVQKQGANTYINLCYPKYDVDGVRPFSEDNDILGGFVATEEELRRSRDEARTAQSDKGRDTLRVLSSILSSTSSRETSVESYRLLLVALFLSGVVEDKESMESLRADAYYLGQCIAFAQGDPVIPVRSVALSEIKLATVRVLSHWDSPERDVSKELIEAAGSTLSGRIASLLLGVRIANEFRDEVSADREVVRRRICTLLGVEDAFKAEGSIRKGKYGAAEGHEVEFKSSYVFRNDGRGADLDFQGRGQVFEAVCAFLNADGGVLYLGVSDTGDPLMARDYGLSADMAWLTANYQRINKSRFSQLGHSVPKADSLDHFVLFLNAEKELYFKDSLQANITIEVTEDADAIRITVAPAEYEIAYLYSDRTRSDGVAYVRDGGRTVPMSRIQKEQRLSSLKRISKEMGFVVTIQEAIDQHRRLVFKDYASGNRGEVKDRYVVPVNLFYNDENVYCLDLESKSYKQFRLHRIGAIEYGEDSTPYTLPVMEPRQADVFRWILPEGGRSYHVRLRMDVGAKNYLLEEYSCAEKLPKEEFYQEKKDKWILDTRVNGLGAVRRFYLGLADRIEILDTEDSEELKKEIAGYVGKYIGEDLL